MLSGHPHIHRAYIRQAYKESGEVLQKLVVETKLKNPQTGDMSDKTQWDKLQDYLSMLAANDFAGFSAVEMHGLQDNRA